MTKQTITIEADTAAEASAKYCAMRDASGEGGSTWPDGGWRGFHISYNGRVWRTADSWRTEPPIYDNY